MANIEQLIHDVVLEIARQRTPEIVAIRRDQKLVADLGLGSIDIAQLVATLEVQLGLNPFASEVSITSVRTFGDLCDVYRSTTPTLPLQANPTDVTP